MIQKQYYLGGAYMEERRKRRPRRDNSIRTKCPFCGGEVDMYDRNSKYIIRENKYLQKTKQYFHITCYQKFYNGEDI